MIALDFEFEGEIWRWKGAAAWHFITLPEDISADIKAFTRHQTHGFRTVRVEARIKEARWKTSLFPDKASGSYFLPVKADIRKKAALSEGDIVQVKLEILV